MIQNAAIISNSKPLLFFTRSIFDTLIIIFICTLLMWYAQYHWKRRKLCRLAAKVNGPLTLPFVGNVLYLFGSTSVDILNVCFRLVNEFQSPVRVWLGQRLCFGVWGPNDLQTILNSPHALQKDDMYKYAESVLGTGLLTAPVVKWKRHRKIIMPTFNQKILDGFLDVFSEQSDILVKQLKKEIGKGTFDIIYYINRYTLDIICGTAMGIQMHAQTTESKYVKWAHQGKDLVFKRMSYFLYHFDFIFNRLSIAQELRYLTKRLDDITATVITEKRIAYQKTLTENKEKPEAFIKEEGSKRNTFIQQLIELSEKDAHLTDQEIRDEVNIFIMAGSDTTASVISFTFIMLGMFPDIQEKVYEEVMDVLGPERAVEPTDLGKLQYMERVIKETMRLFPAGPCIGRSVTEDIKLEKCIIPAGSSVFLMIIGLHRDPKTWPNPLKFNPDRFLPEEVAKRHPYSWLPFSGGPRNCIGYKYAMMSMKAVITSVIRKYKFYTDYKCIEDIKLKADLALHPVDGYKVSIEPRE